MAWLQNLAGKAEDLLVKFDQNAANVFQDSNIKINEDTRLYENSINIIERVPEVNITVPRLELDNTLLIQNNIKNVDTSNVIISKETTTVHDNITKSSEYLEDGIGMNINKDIDDTQLCVYNNEIDKLSKNECSNQFLVRSGSSDMSFVPDEDPLTKFEEKLSKLELENAEMNQQLTNIRHSYSELQNENANVQNQLERATESLMATQKEMEKYRARAQRILQEKEKLIGLKQSNVTAINNNEEILATYNKELKKELQFQEEKNLELSIKLTKTTNELSTFQQKLVLIQKEHQSAIQNIQLSLLNEKTIRNTLEEECHTKTKELQNALQEIQLKTTIISNNSNEIARLKDTIKRSSFKVINNDFQLRLQELTQTLMCKQNALEIVTTERNALCLQIEKLENKHKTLQQLQRSNVKSINIEIEEGKSEVPNFMKISPFDAGVTRKVKHAYSTLDAISIRTGIFLRRYPVARVFVFCYMILLHVWVLIILCTGIPSY